MFERPIADLFQGAAVVIVADLIPERLAQAASFGCATVNVASSIPVSTQVRLYTGMCALAVCLCELIDASYRFKLTYSLTL